MFQAGDRTDFVTDELDQLRGQTLRRSPGMYQASLAELHEHIDELTEGSAQLEAEIAGHHDAIGKLIEQIDDSDIAYL